MKTNPREILLYYNPESSKDKKTVALASSLSKHVKTFAFSKTPSTSTSWTMILRALGKHPKELLNKANPFYQSNIKGKDFDEEGWLDIIAHHPELLRSPIAIRGDKAILCESPTDIYKL